MIGNAGSTAHIGFYLVPNFSLLAFSSAIEPLRMANQLSGHELYKWTLISSDGQPVLSSNGLSFSVALSAENRERFDAVFVCAGLNVHQVNDEPGLTFFKKFEKTDTVIGAICTGTYLLAKAELLNEHRCTIHWENLASTREQFPQLIVSPELFEIDNNRYTCAGGTAPVRYDAF